MSVSVVPLSVSLSMAVSASYASSKMFWKWCRTVYSVLLLAVNEPVMVTFSAGIVKSFRLQPLNV